MRRVIVLSIVFTIVQCAAAALPPRYQNIKDLDVMVDFIKAHPKVASGLRSIDMVEYTVYFGSGCKAVFGRKTTPKPPGWAGPADPLEFKKATCPVR